jgi:hypothetical protein
VTRRSGLRIRAVRAVLVFAALLAMHGIVETRDLVANVAASQPHAVLVSDAASAAPGAPRSKPRAEASAGQAEAERPSARREYLLIAYGLAVSIAAVTLLAAVASDRRDPKG